METTQSLSRKWYIPFFSIWTGQVFSLFGSSVVGFALVWWLTTLTGSATVLATATLVAMLPQILLGPLAGAYVDRWNRRMVMIVADLLVALTTLWLAYLFWRGSVEVWQVYIAMLVRSIGGAFHFPAMQASTSLMVPGKHLTRVAGLNQALYGGMNIVGPPAGALLLEIMPMQGIMLIDVFTALLAITPLLFVFVPQPQRRAAVVDGADGGPASRPSIWQDLVAGFKYVARWPGAMWLLGMAMAVNFVITPAASLMPLLVKDYFNGQAIQLAAMEAAWGFGVIAGGLALGIWGGFKRRIYTSLMGLCLMGVGMSLVGMAPAWMFWLAVFGFGFAGFMNPLANGPLMAILQATVAPDMQGRVFTLIGSMASLMSPLSLAIAGPVSDLTGVRVWYLVGGILCAIMGLAAGAIPAVLHLEDGPPGAPALALAEANISEDPALPDY